MPPLGLELAGGESPIQAAPGGSIPRRRARPVNQLGEEPGALVCGEDADGGEVGDERTAGVHLLPKARGRVLDLLSEVDRLVRVPPPLHPRVRVVAPPRGIVPAGCGRREVRVIAPCEVRRDLLDAAREERAPLPLPEVGHGGQAAVGVLEGRRPAKQIDIHPGPRVDPAQHPLPTVQYGVQLFGGVAVYDGRGQPGDRHQLAVSGETRTIVGEPSPIRQLVGQRAGCVVVGQFSIGGGHGRACRRAWVVRTYHGCSAHFAGSYRVLNRTDSRRMVSMCGSVRQAHHPTP